jgi:hypothetical protein
MLFTLPCEIVSGNIIFKRIGILTLDCSGSTVAALSITKQELLCFPNLHTVIIRNALQWARESTIKSSAQGLEEWVRNRQQCRLLKRIAFIFCYAEVYTLFERLEQKMPAGAVTWDGVRMNSS